MSARKFYESNRRTGRTTRMLLYVLFGVIRYKRRAYIIAANARHAEYMVGQLRQLLEQNNVYYEFAFGRNEFVFGGKSCKLLNVDGCFEGSIQFVLEGRVEAAQVNTDFSLPVSPVFEDHYTVECRIKEDLEKLHRWDLEQ